MPDWVVFLATVKDPSQESVVYGARTVLDKATAGISDAWLNILRQEGKVSVFSGPDPRTGVNLTGMWPGVVDGFWPASPAPPEPPPPEPPEEPEEPEPEP